MKLSSVHFIAAFSFLQKLTKLNFDITTVALKLFWPFLCFALLLESHSRGFCETMRSLQVELPTPIFCIFKTTRLCGDSPSRTRCCCGWADQPENDTFMTMLLNCNNLFGDINHDIGNGMALIFLKIIAHPRFWYMKRSRLGQGLHSLYVWSEPLLQVLQNIFFNTFLTFVSLHGFVTGIFCV